jgi:hypothetical protein
MYPQNNLGAGAQWQFATVIVVVVLALGLGILVSNSELFHLSSLVKSYPMNFNKVS